MSILKQKIVDHQQARELRQYWADQKFRVVFTNGCFDIVHPGHVLYLEAAKAQGDKLIVGLNSDDSVRGLKGPERPIQDESARAIVLAGLESVDMVVIFDSQTPLELIKKLSPDVLVKGGDWQIAQIVGADHVLDQGGEVKSLNFEAGHSTSFIVNKIKRNEG